MSLAGLLGVTALALAAPGPVPDPPMHPATYELQWTVPLGCPTAESIHEYIARLAKQSSTGKGTLEVVGRIEPIGNEFLLTLETDFFDRHDERTAIASDCSELSESVALVVAIALDPSLGTSVDPVYEHETDLSEMQVAVASTQPTDELESVDLGPSDQTFRPPPHRPSKRTVRRGTKTAPEAILFRLAPEFEYGRVPPSGGGVELAIVVTWPRIRFETYGSYLWPRRASGPSGSSGLYQFGSAGLRGCGRPRARRVEFPVCLGLEAGAMRVDSRGLNPATILNGRWLGPSVGVGVAVSGRRVGFLTLAEGSVAAFGSRIFVGETVVFRPRFAARILLGIELRFSIAID